MGRHTCRVCGSDYYERRFIWESQKRLDELAPEVELELGERLVELSVPDDVKEMGFACTRHPESLRLVVSRVNEESWAEIAGLKAQDEIVQVNGIALDSLGQDELIRAMHSRPLAIVSKAVSETVEHRRDSLKQYADALRATGTTANLTGTVLPSLAHALGPVSAVGGVCGVAGGISQLWQGLSLPSGRTDPHLVAKGAVATSVGVTCTTLGAAATVLGAPALIAALGLGIVGLGTVTTIDATMDGICLDCRSARSSEQGKQDETFGPMSDTPIL